MKGGRKCTNYFKVQAQIQVSNSISNRC